MVVFVFCWRILLVRMVYDCVEIKGRVIGYGWVKERLRSIRLESCVVYVDFDRCMNVEFFVGERNIVW